MLLFQWYRDMDCVIHNCSFAFEYKKRYNIIPNIRLNKFTSHLGNKKVGTPMKCHGTPHMTFYPDDDDIMTGVHAMKLKKTDDVIYGCRLINITVFSYFN